MMRRSTIIIGVVVVVVLAAGIIALLVWPVQEPEPLPVETPPVESAALADLINESQDDVAGIHFAPLGGTAFSLYRDPESGDIELETVDAVFGGARQLMRSLYTIATNLINLTVVAEDADDEQITMFGFNEPVAAVRLERVDGTSIELEVGAQQAVGHGHFARLRNSREIFLLSQRQSAHLSMSVEDVYDISFFPMDEFIDFETLFFSVENILIERDHDVIELNKRTQEELAETPFGSSHFQILQPHVAEGNDAVIQTDVIEHIIGIMPTIVETVRPADLSVYGLDIPDRLTVTAGDWSGTLLIGRRDTEREGRFVMIEGYDAVLLDTFGDYSFLNVPFSRLRTSLIWLHNIIDVSSVTFIMDGVSRVLRLEHYDDELRGWLDNAPISETNARRLYLSALRITQNGESNEPIPTDDFPVYTVIIYFLDGSTDAIELYQLNESQFLIVHGGVSTDSFITRMSLQQNLLDRFDIVDAGGEIPPG